jgi:hypothetical protein
MNQVRQKDMHMAVPETRSHNRAVAVNDWRTAWDLDTSAGAYSQNVAIMYENGAIFDWPFRR